MLLSHNPSMSDQNQAAQALKQLRKRAGLSVRQTAADVGVPLSTYSSYERTFKRPYLPIELVTKLINVFAGRGDPPISRKEVLALGVPQEDVGELSELLENVSDGDAIISASIVEESLTRKAGYDRYKPIVFHASDDFLPVRAIVQSERQVWFNLLDKEIGSKARPPGVGRNESAFAFFAPDDRMAPRWRRGEVVFVQPFRPPSPGEHALFFINQDGRQQDEVYFAKFVIAYGDRVVIEFYTVNARNNGSIAMGFHSDDIQSMWRVYEWDELIV